MLEHYYLHLPKDISALKSCLSKCRVSLFFEILLLPAETMLLPAGGHTLMGQEQALKHPCLELEHRSCFMFLWAHCPYCGFQSQEKVSSKWGERWRGSTEALSAFCQRAALSQLLRVRGITNRYTISMYYFFPSKELAGKQIRDSSHSPFSHLVIWTYDKARIMLPGVWLGFSVQVCPIRLDNISLYFPIAVRAIYIIPMCCWTALCWRNTFFSLFIE